MDLTRAFPNSFDFYGIADVRPLESSDVTDDVLSLEEIETGMAIRFYGDISAWLVFLTEKGLDPSVSLEVGNVLCSKMATGLYHSDSLDVMISPPSPLSRPQIATALRFSGSVTQRKYGFFHKNKMIPITVLVFSQPPKEFGDV